MDLNHVHSGTPNTTRGRRSSPRTMHHFTHRAVWRKSSVGDHCAFNDSGTDSGMTERPTRPQCGRPREAIAIQDGRKRARKSAPHAPSADRSIGTHRDGAKRPRSSAPRIWDSRTKNNAVEVQAKSLSANLSPGSRQLCTPRQPPPTIFISTVPEQSTPAKEKSSET